PMVQRIYRCLCSVDPGQVPGGSGKSHSVSVAGVTRDQLVIFLADILRGTAQERAPLVLAMSQSPGPQAASVSCDQDLIAAVIQILAHRGRLLGWRPERMGDSSVSIKLLSEQMCSELKPSGNYIVISGNTCLCCDRSCLEDWIFRVPGVSLYLDMVVSEGFNVSLRGRSLNIYLALGIHTVLVSQQLPDRYSAPWRLVFSTKLHGESFTRMVTGLLKCGCTLLLIKDTKGHVFGGFASQDWEIKPQFQGDSRCFLFTVSPFLRVYNTTGYNQHFMYLNQNQQTMPNGLGMGGQHNYFGLWLDCDFGRGHSRANPKCTTYGSPRLSADEDFIVETVEVWAVGKLPEPEEGPGKKSVLDVDPELQAIMEMTGKTLHSQGLREPEDDEG
uniref:MTOR-associated protein MEAK7 n=1 Tax=Periophthalmus magnuspinnatus TaxID=409849 RepID=A0A3B3ZCC5_9GOBI